MSHPGPAGNRWFPLDGSRRTASGADLPVHRETLGGAERFRERPRDVLAGAGTGPTPGGSGGLSSTRVERLLERHELMLGWLGSLFGATSFDLSPASSDASFRRYWRIVRNNASLILMDAPPPNEDCSRFADLARRFRAIGLNTPEIHAEDPANGFLLLSDLGDRPYLSMLEPDSADRLYGDALGALAIIQACGPTDGLPEYDAPFLERELGIFDEWFLERYLGLKLSSGERAGLSDAYVHLVASALEQPQVCVHRDFHSRNLMVTGPPNPGVLDFQDAVVGPVTYDLVSLLRDCYIAWPEDRVAGWAIGYLDLACQSGILPPTEPERFLRWFDLMGTQRHLKACGIFARLHLRDAKPGYLEDIPRTLGYVRDVAGRYDELEALSRLLAERVAPALARLS